MNNDEYSQLPERKNINTIAIQIFSGLALFHMFQVKLDEPNSQFQVARYFSRLYVTLCAIWYRLHNFKKAKKTYGGVLLFIKL